MNGQPGHQAASWNACSACFLVLLIRDLLTVSDVMRRSGCEPEWCTAFVLCIKPTDGCSHPGPPSLRTLQDDCLPAGLLPARPCRAGILPGHPGALLPAFSVDASCLLPAATARPLGWLPRCCLASVRALHAASSRPCRLLVIACLVVLFGWIALPHGGANVLCLSFKRPPLAAAAGGQPGRTPHALAQPPVRIRVAEPHAVARNQPRGGFPAFQPGKRPGKCNAVHIRCAPVAAPPPG